MGGRGGGGGRSVDPELLSARRGQEMTSLPRRDPRVLTSVMSAEGIALGRGFAGAPQGSWPRIRKNSREFAARRRGPPARELPEAVGQEFARTAENSQPAREGLLRQHPARELPEAVGREFARTAEN